MDAVVIVLLVGESSGYWPACGGLDNGSGKQLVDTDEAGQQTTVFHFSIQQASLSVSGSRLKLRAPPATVRRE